MLSLKVPAVDYHEACLFAYCAPAPAGTGREGRRQAVCATLASYAQDCGKRGTHVLWRKPGFCGRPPHPAGLGLEGGPSCDPYF